MGGLTAHVKNTKDLDHEEFRRSNPDLRASLRAEGDPAGESDAPEPEADPEAGDPSGGEDPPDESGPEPGEQRRDVVVRPPEVVDPLMDREDARSDEQGSGEADDAREGAEAGEIEGAGGQDGEEEPAGPAIEPGQLEPFIAGGVEQAVNGLYLTEEGDGQISRQEVGDSGFPAAVEQALVHYFPEVRWDHPGVVVFISAAGLATAIQAKKGDGEAPEGLEVEEIEDAEEPETEEVPAEEAGVWGQVANGDAVEPDESEPEEPEGGGSGYWSGIQRQAGGGPA